MDKRLLDYYNRELQYLRELGGEFAKRFPRIAGRLGLDEFECADPYVERLLEGFAFLSARVQLKIDAEFPRFTQSLMSILAPQLLAPTPSMAVVQLKPSLKQGALSEGFRVPRGSQLKATPARGENTVCEYRTAHDVNLWPLELAQVSHSSYLGDLGDIKVTSRRTVRGALRLRLRTLGGIAAADLKLDRLPFFLRGPERLGMRLYELLVAGAQGIVVRDGNGKRAGFVPGDALRPLGFGDDESLLPAGLTSFQGYRLLQEYFALPSRFLFVELQGLAPGISACEASEFELVVLLDRYDADLEARVSAEHFALFCSPAANLFPKKVDRIHLNERDHEYHVVADRTQPLDFEIHSLTEVLGYGAQTSQVREFLPFYSSTERGHRENLAYYTLDRQVRTSSARQKATGPRSTYAGSEVFVSLVDGDEGPYHSDLRQLGINALCTNRDLPLFMSLGAGKTDMTLDSGAPVESIRCVAGPSEPRPSPAWGNSAWRLVSHLTQNHLSLGNGSDGLGAAPLRETLHLYAELGAASARREIDGVRAVDSASVVRRLPYEGPASFARGLEITVDCDETAFEGSSLFLFGSVLDRFFQRYVSINSFTETVLRSPQRGEVMRWPARLGRRSSV
jgi:type VI secretion system protein ImpG